MAMGSVERDCRIITMRSQGKSLGEIADEVGMSREGVRLALLRIERHLGDADEYRAALSAESSKEE